MAGEGKRAVRTIPKAATGISGLDEVLWGGVPQGKLTLVSGGPGTGKTMLGLEFVVRGAAVGEPGLMLTFEERGDDLRRYASGITGDLAAAEREGKLALMSVPVPPNAVVSGEFDLEGILAVLRDKTEAIGARRVVIDAPDVVLRLLDDPTEERTELHRLHEWILDTGLTALMTVKAPSDGEIARYSGLLDYMASCVIRLDQRVFQQVTTRRLRVVKYRGSGYGRNEYPFGISEGGVWIIPVTQASLQHQSLGESMTTGVPTLDELLGGGYRRSSCTLITGGTGTGKTTFVCSFVRAAADAGDRVLYLDFEESWDALASCMLSPGIDLRPARESGLLRFVSSMPESQGIEEHLIQAYRAIEELDPDHLVVDAISACGRMGDSHAAFDYLLRLIDHCKQRGITTLLTNLAAAGEEDEITGVDLSSLIDTVIILRNTEAEGRFRRELMVLKSRGRAHSPFIHPFEITDRGIAVLPRGGSDEH